LVFVAHKVFAKLDRLVAEMVYPELEKAARIAVGLVREDFPLLTVSVRETRRRLNDAQTA
jgi:hypothetical protein